MRIIKDYILYRLELVVVEYKCLMITKGNHVWDINHGEMVRLNKRLVTLRHRYKILRSIADSCKLMECILKDDMRYTIGDEDK